MTIGVGGNGTYGPPGANVSTSVYVPGGKRASALPLASVTIWTTTTLLEFKMLNIAPCSGTGVSPTNLITPLMISKIGRLAGGGVVVEPGGGVVVGPGVVVVGNGVVVKPGVVGGGV